jgi:hypothetical protein
MRTPTRLNAGSLNRSKSSFVFSLAESGFDRGEWERKRRRNACGIGRLLKINITFCSGEFADLMLALPDAFLDPLDAAALSPRVSPSHPPANTAQTNPTQSTFDNHTRRDVCSLHLRLALLKYLPPCTTVNAEAQKTLIARGLLLICIPKVEPRLPARAFFFQNRCIAQINASRSHCNISAIPNAVRYTK